MSDEEELASIIERVIELYGSSEDVSPAWIATQAMVLIEFSRELHRLGYAGCHLELRQIARAKLRKRFDPTSIADDDADDQPDFFPETLQERYPKARTKKSEEPIYRKLDALTDEDVRYNVGRMRRASGALERHADRLQAWHTGRSSAA
jgi:hypothetical protein